MMKTTNTTNTAAIRARQLAAVDLQKVMARFKKKVAKQEEEPFCWLWMAARSSGDGYGFFWFRGRQMGAHQASYLLHKGEIPPGFIVRHTCDNRWCVNPDHLLVGTSADNAHDMVSRGRHRSGTALLTKEQVRAIRAEYVKRDGELLRLAEKYGVRATTIHAIVARVNWVGVEPATTLRVEGEAPVTRRARGAAHHGAKLTDADVVEIRAARRAGESVDVLATRFGVSRATISHIATRRTWKHVTEPASPTTEPVSADTSKAQ